MCVNWGMCNMSRPCQQGHPWQDDFRGRAQDAWVLLVPLPAAAENGTNQPAAAAAGPAAKLPGGGKALRRKPGRKPKQAI